MAKNERLDRIEAILEQLAVQAKVNADQIQKNGTQIEKNRLAQAKVSEDIGLLTFNVSRLERCIAEDRLDFNEIKELAKSFSRDIASLTQTLVQNGTI